MKIKLNKNKRDTIFRTLRFVFFAAALAACAKHKSSSVAPSVPAPAAAESADRSSADLSSNGTNGPTCPAFDYHDLYASITSTQVTVKGTAVVRTEDGQKIQVPIEPTQLDLQKLDGQSPSQTDIHGVVVRLSQVALPDTVTQVELAELVLHVVAHGNNQLLFNNDSSCHLHAPNRLFLYTLAPVVLDVKTGDVKQDYLVKAKFSTLNGITFDTERKCVKSGCKVHNHHHDNDDSTPTAENSLDKDIDSDDSRLPAHYGGGKKCHGEIKCVLRCQLANKRYQITDVRRFPQDEF